MRNEAAMISSTYEELFRVIRYARNRWRLRVALRGGLIVLGVGFLSFAASVAGMDYLLYSETAVQVLRILTYVTLLGLVLRFLILPLARRVPNEQVALYIEEHEPSLQAALVSAVEIGSRSNQQEQTGATATELSPQLLRRLVAVAVQKCQEIDYGHGIERSRLRRFSAGLAGVGGAGMLAVLLSPAFLQHGALLLFLPWKGEVLANPYQITVSPGNISVPRGSDQQIVAFLEGFDADRVELALKERSGQWQRWPMNRSESGAEKRPALDLDSNHDFMLLNLQEQSEYFVEANGVRSPLHRIDVTDLPYVERIDLEYAFPAYTGLANERVEAGGDIAALRGTQVSLEITPTFAVSAGRLVVEDGEAIDLVADGGGLLTASLTVESETFYRVELRDREGTFHRSSPEYAIEVLLDQPPSLRIKKPGRDVKANKIEEVFAEIEAQDDYGVNRLELVYSLNGEDEELVVLYGRGRNSAPKKEVRAGHTFFLEEHDLVEGDLISYYARVRDGNRVNGRQTATSDIYFIEIRPFGQNFQQAQQGGGGMGGGGLDNSLSLRQRQIIAATFRLSRDRREYSRKELSENLATLALLQGRLRDQVDTLVTRMGHRATLLADTDFKTIIDFLGQASDEMGPAQEELEAERPQKALPAEQRALKSLQRAEAVFRDVRVSFNPSGGGGGGDSQRLAEDLADLFELELDKLRNQYETVQRGQQQEVENQVDEALQKLRELARRQQQENERARRRAGSQQGGGGSPSQQQLVEETEELARRLERLAREHSTPELQETARRLRDAADAMKRSSTTRSGQSLAHGISALDRLRGASRLLDKSRQSRLKEQMDEIAGRANRIVEMQDRIRSQVEEMGAQAEAGASGAENGERLGRLLERKDQLGQEVAGLERELDRMARQARGEQKEAARQLRGAAESIRENQLKEKIRYSKGVVQGREANYARLFEEEIGADVQEVRDRIAEAKAAVGQSPAEERRAALERTRELVQSMESLEARLRDQGRVGSEEAGREQGQRGDGQERGQGEEQAQGQERGEGQGQGQEQGGERQAEAGRGSSTGPAGERAAGSEGERGQGQRDGVGAPRGGLSQLGSDSTSGYFQPGIFTQEDLRQAQRELEQRIGQGEELRQALREQEVEVADLDSLLNQMRRLNLRQINNDPLALDQLRNQVVEGLRQFEYRLWRELESENETLRLSTSDQVPRGFRDLVEEYFKKLSESD